MQGTTALGDMMRIRIRARAALALCAVALWGLTACQGDGEPATSETATEAEPAPTAEDPSDRGGTSPEGASDGGGASGEGEAGEGAPEPPGADEALPQLALGPWADDATQAKLVAGFGQARADEVSCDLQLAPDSTDPALCTVEGSSIEYSVHAVRGTDAEATPSLLVTAGPLPEGVATTATDPDTTVGYGSTSIFFDDPSLLEADGLLIRAQLDVDSIGASAEVRECAAEADAADAPRVECSAVGGEDSPHGEGTPLAITLRPAISASGDPIVIGLVRPLAS